VKISLEGPASLQRFDHTLRDCESVEDEIEQRLAALKYLRDVCHDWNQDVEPADISKMEGALRTRQDTLTNWMKPNLELREVSSFDDPFTPPIKLQDLPTIPGNWICRDLFQAHDWNLNFSAKNTAIRKEQPLPP